MATIHATNNTVDSTIATRYLDMLKTAFGDEILPWLHDKTVIEIMVNPDGKLWIEQLGQGVKFTGHTIPHERAERIVKLVASYKGFVVDEHNPVVEAEIPIGNGRFEGWLPPVVRQATFDIRMPAIQIFTLDHYIQAGSLTEKQKKALQQCIQTRQNILVVGGTGSGKTTFVNALLKELSGSPERVLVLEDLPELQVDVKDKVNMLTSPHVTMQMLVKGTLRMRPDRIIIGEVRDGAALDMLKAWNTGHPGGLCTLHANSIESTPDRLADLVLEVVLNVPQNLIADAVNVIVFMQRNPQGRHQVKRICRISGFDGHHYQFKDLA